MDDSAVGQTEFVTETEAIEQAPHRRIESEAAYMAARLRELKNFAESVRGGLTLEIAPGFGYVEWPCDICGDRRETGHVLNIRIAGDKHSFICSNCAKRFAPDLFNIWEEVTWEINIEILEDSLADFDPGKGHQGRGNG